MKRAKHSLSHYRLTTLNQGVLFPVSVLEVLPGDSFRHQTSCLLRVSPLVAPVMHPVHVQIHSWYVPNRLLWANWETFITNTQSSLTIPTIDVAANSTIKAFAQSFGIGVNSVSSLLVNALPFRAYNQIWNEFYRDQDLSVPATENITDTDTEANYRFKNVSWQKDYFTIARPYPQQGAGSQVALLTGTAPVRTQSTEHTTSGVPSLLWRNSGGTKPQSNQAVFDNPSGSLAYSSTAGTPAAGSSVFPTNLMADLSGSAVSMDINEWRRAMAYQKIREHRNRYGSRYTDYLRFLGVRPSDARLQRPEYLGGGKQTISFSEVLATATTTESTLGDLGGHGIAALRTRPYKRFFEEHGYVITMLSVRPMTVYMNQVPRTFLRRTWPDFWQKELEMMGEQPILNAEVFADAPTPNGVFGYIPRHDDYRRKESFVSGEFRSVLDYWHMARSFSSQPVLNGSFVNCDPTNRIYASTTNDQLYAMIAHNVSARRLVSKVARTM